MKHTIAPPKPHSHFNLLSNMPDFDSHNRNSVICASHSTNFPVSSANSPFTKSSVISSKNRLNQARKSEVCTSFQQTFASAQETNIMKYVTKGKVSVSSLSIPSFPSSGIKTALSNYQPCLNISKTAKIIDLRNSHISDFPKELLETTCLQSLRLDHNHIYSIPENIIKLTSLEILSLSHNELKCIEKNLSLLKGLRALALDNNKLDQWPEWICTKLFGLRLLYLHGNGSIPGMPICFSKMASLERFSFDWITYIQPDVGAVLKNNHGKKIILEIRLWCMKIAKNPGITNEYIAKFLEFYDAFVLNKKTKATLEHTLKLYPKKRSLLHVAARLGHYGIIKELLEVNYPINLQDSDGSTAFSLAIDNGKIDCAKLLLSKSNTIDTNICIKDNNPLLSAIKSGRYDLAEAIAEHQCTNINIKDITTGNTALHILFDRFDSYPLLIHGVCNKILNYHDAFDINVPNLTGYSALHNGALYRQRQAILFALDYNIKTLTQKGYRRYFDFSKAGGKDGLTVLHEIASRMDANTLFKVLKMTPKHYIDIFKRDYYGRTARMLVKDALANKLVLRKEIEVIKELITNQAETTFIEIASTNQPNKEVIFIGGVPSRTSTTESNKVNFKDETQKIMLGGLLKSQIQTNNSEQNIQSVDLKKYDIPAHKIFNLIHISKSFSIRETEKYENKNLKCNAEEIAPVEIIKKSDNYIEVGENDKLPLNTNISDNEQIFNEECNVNDEISTERKQISFFYRPSQEAPKTTPFSPNNKMNSIALQKLESFVLGKNRYSNIYKIIVDENIPKWKRYKNLYGLIKKNTKETIELLPFIFRKLENNDSLKTDIPYLLGIVNMNIETSIGNIENENISLLLKHEIINVRKNTEKISNSPSQHTSRCATKMEKYTYITKAKNKNDIKTPINLVKYAPNLKTHPNSKTPNIKSPSNVKSPQNFSAIKVLKFNPKTAISYFGP